MSSHTSPDSHLTPDELIKHYPEVDLFGWNQSKIGTFYSSGLLLGKRRFLKACIQESSFLELVKYANTILEKKRLTLGSSGNKFFDYLTPDELVHKYPNVYEILGWNASKIGMFLSSGLLIGRRNGKENKALIIEDSFLDLIHYSNALVLKRQLKY